MESRFDYPDPGTDPAYCDSLSLEPDGPICIYCGNPLSEGETDYCSAMCAHHAELNNKEGRA